LIENAVKHITGSVENPLIVSISACKYFLIVKNNLNELYFKNESKGIGLANLNE